MIHVTYFFLNKVLAETSDLENGILEPVKSIHVQRWKIHVKYCLVKPKRTKHLFFLI